MSLYSKASSMRKQHSQSERGVRVSMKTTLVKKGKAQTSGVALNKKKPKVRAGRKTLRRCYGAGGLNGDGGGREKAEEHESCRPSCLPIATFSATLLIAASPLKSVYTEISILLPGALLSKLMRSPQDTRLLSRLRFVRVQRGVSLFVRP
eukprot:2958140-Pleurochrysis_carterae.AAC.3